MQFRVSFNVNRCEGINNEKIIVCSSKTQIQAMQLIRKRFSFRLTLGLMQFEELSAYIFLWIFGNELVRKEPRKLQFTTIRFKLILSQPIRKYLNKFLFDLIKSTSIYAHEKAKRAMVLENKAEMKRENIIYIWCP